MVGSGTFFESWDCPRFRFRAAGFTWLACGQTAGQPHLIMYLCIVAMLQAGAPSELGLSKKDPLVRRREILGSGGGCLAEALAAAVAEDVGSQLRSKPGADMFVEVARGGADGAHDASIVACTLALIVDRSWESLATGTSRDVCAIWHQQASLSMRFRRRSGRCMMRWLNWQLTSGKRPMRTPPAVRPVTMNTCWRASTQAARSAVWCWRRRRPVVAATAPGNLCGSCGRGPLRDAAASGWRATRPR